MNQPSSVDPAFAAIEAAILPNLSLLIDNMLEAAALARPGVDAEAHAEDLRRIAGQARKLTMLVAEAAAPLAHVPATRMSA